MNYIAFEITNDDYLAHHGVKGQRWGVRRYQKDRQKNKRNQHFPKWYKEEMKKASVHEKKNVKNTLAGASLTALSVAGILATNKYASKLSKLKASGTYTPGLKQLIHLGTGVALTAVSTIGSFVLHNRASMEYRKAQNIRIRANDEYNEQLRKKK